MGCDMTVEIHINAAAGRPVIEARTSTGVVTLPALWLRERAHSPDQLDAVTQQRLFNPHELPVELSITSASQDGERLHLCFSDGYSGDYELGVLAAAISPPPLLPALKPWRSNLDPVPRVAWSSLSDEARLLDAVTAYLEYGFLIVENTPTERDSILTIAAKFGFVRETNFGRYFEVYSRADSEDLAYRPVRLGPHTDNPYREPVPGIQLLHCLKNETTGGLSTLVDGFACTEMLRAEDPDGYRLLADLSVRYHFDDPDTSLAFDRPILDVDDSGKFRGIHYSPRLDRLPLVDEATLKGYQVVRRRLAALVTDPAFELRYRLREGELVMFDNNRVLHGRTAFNPDEGTRHLQGCYMDRDGPGSLYRVLRRKATPGQLPAEREEP